MPHQYARIVSRKSGRSVTGCGNCKIRKVKCDEEKPACLRCQNRNVECPGYPANVLRWSSKHEVPEVGRTQHVAKSNQRRIDDHSTTLRATRPSVVHEDNLRLGDSSCSSIAERIEVTSSLSEGSGRFDGITSSAINDITGTVGEIGTHSEGIEYAFEMLTADLGLALSDASFENGYVFSPPLSTASDNHTDSPRVPILVATEQDHDSQSSANTSVSDIDQTGPRVANPLSVEAFVPHSVSLTRRRKGVTPTPSLPATLLHVPTLLVEYYFQKVCRDCSTFDSPANPFRSKISEMQQSSAPIHYVIQSLAASKLADDMPRMRVVGIEAQGKALQTLKKEFSAVNVLHAMSDEVLFALLLLGMTTSWHSREDLGLEYLQLACRIVTAKTQISQGAIASNLDFYQNALRYWAMIASMVSGEIEYPDTAVVDPYTAVGPPSLSMTEDLMPHPWAGISPRSLQLFGQILQLIRKTRCEGSRTSSSYSKAGIMGIAKAIASAEQLEAECWSVSIPPVHRLKDTGDSSTPPLHHVLTAKAYLMSALLHLYMIFPDVLDARIQSTVASGTLSSASEAYPGTAESAHVMDHSYLWSQRSLNDHRDMWLRDIGHRIVECLEGIDSRSSTRVVHPPLLLSVASALTLSRELDVPWSHAMEVSDVRVHQCRSFIISRLEIMHAAMRFHAIDNILQVIKEIWKRSDAGRQDIFWMDVMSELSCETIFG